MNNNHTYREIARQPETWRETEQIVSAGKGELLRPFEEFKPEEILFTGCGSSYFLSVAAAYLFQEKLGISAKAVPASDILMNPDAVFAGGRRTLVVGSSRSGDTTELVRAMEVARKQPSVRTLGITTRPDSLLGREGEALILPHVQEKSVVMTGSFSNMLLALQLMAGHLSGDAAYLDELKRLPELGRERMAKAEELGRIVGEDRRFDHYIFLGQGSFFGLALEGMLKLKEMTQVQTEAFNPLEFRHGPISVLNERCRVILLSHRLLRPYLRSLIEDLRRLKAEVVLIDEAAGEEADILWNLESGLSDPSRALLYLPFLHFLAYFRAMSLGLNPDRPRHLNQVVVLEEEEG
ncbi:glucosamine--fructose-6-phosphate aminotransferase (isomerizing) [Planifilum fulgidum]|jgi:glutamine---fructose-6-phosphate transaminase (isomerizing)|uniref:Glucosamine--fructose-6-phosphate aminotransferase (Isomerizing) n=1 Tax=Planifilum fulgidum TaxID=201973 RepID=A0A1I2MX75_9BACL|nr:SIS domain-containing protein [Planifilum fulgidum]MBO2497084.1 SIS domain-containing protein [Bacillota bacterium]SFF96195.1 glucosamine--fructose-6-phosphate aminotransferase (isomerizing) [Planifilum fulgidum]